MDRDDEMAHKIISFRSPWCWSCRCCGCIIIYYLFKLLQSPYSEMFSQLLMRKFDFTREPHHATYPKCPPCWPRALVFGLWTYFGEELFWAFKAGCSALPWLTFNTPHSSNIKFDHDIIRKHHISWYCIVCPWIPSFTAPNDYIVKSNISCGGTIISKKLNCHHDICLKVSHW